MAFLNRWDPFTEIARLQDEMTRQMFRAEPRAAGFVPPVDIYEEKDAIYVKAELPGVKPEQVQLHVENNILTLTGERKLERDGESARSAGRSTPEENGAGFHRIERTYGTFTRSFALPNNVVGDEVLAEMNDGILTVKIPKKPEVQPKRIEVRPGPGASGQRQQLKPGQSS